MAQTDDSLHTKRDARIAVRLPADLKEFATKYALEKNTTVSALVVDYFTTLRDEEKMNVPQF